MAATQTLQENESRSKLFELKPTDRRLAPEHLPSHTTFDLSVGKSFGENWNVRVSGLNLSNHRYLLDNSNTFGGTHFVNPREISVQLKYRFHY